MLNKKILFIILIIVFALTLFTGCKESKKEVIETMVNELAYLRKMGIDEPNRLQGHFDDYFNNDEQAQKQICELQKNMSSIQTTEEMIREVVNERTKRDNLDSAEKDRIVATIRATIYRLAREYCEGVDRDPKFEYGLEY
jgi:cell shape-determining protein MreC